MLLFHSLVNLLAESVSVYRLIIPFMTIKGYTGLYKYHNDINYLAITYKEFAIV